ncbi:tyrosine-type recombinase/integrase [Rhodovulum marinum]|uniref:Phage integrase family protein n=1 Tax=Rhodovulum marinum TaxID=320662 RepID=A0A4R2Q7R6_9RHOB|nr:tyrosine-type recombinase/integrase [Rhodovulum marinum]TCP43958.1 phage integrase family protein [Rhodovulum marinum]
MALKLFRRKPGGNWIIRGKLAGKSVYESSGTSERRLAEAKRVRLEREILERECLGREATITFAEAALAYVEAGGSPRFLDRILRYAGPDTLLRDVNNAWVREAAEALYPDCAPATIDRQLVTPVSAVVNMAAEDDLCPPRRFRKRAKDRARVRWITPEEAEALLAAVRELQPHTLRPVALMLGGGLRSGEALRVARADIREATGEVWIPETKNGEPRMIRLPRRALDLLRAEPLPEEGPVCRTPKGEPYVLRENGGGQIAAAFAKVVAAADLDPREVTPHVLRHTWATWYHAATRDFGALMDLGGWKTPAMANRYRKLAPEDLADRLLARGWDFTRADFRAPRLVETIIARGR